MSIHHLIGAVVRQTTVLIAQLATSGGARAPLSHVANQVFLELVQELERQGISRKVSADMFGMGLRTYLRRIQRLSESSTDQGRSLWEVVLEYLRQNEVVTRAQVLRRFHRDDESQVRSVLFDLTESGLVFCSGSGAGSVFRVATDAELGKLRQLRSGEGLDELVWATIYREGPFTEQALARVVSLPNGELSGVLTRLESSGRIDVDRALPEARYSASSFYVPLGGSVGWEAAVFDHFQAVVQTICQRVDPSTASESKDEIGGSTFTLDVWSGHPLEAEARGSLARLRASFCELRRRVEEHNQSHGLPADYAQVVVYFGQCVIPREESVES